MSANDEDDDDVSEKTSVVRSDTLRVTVDPNYKVPPCLVMIVGPSGKIGHQWVLDQPRLTLGRSPNSDIYTADLSVSKSHAQFQIIEEAINIIDLGATNVTLVNDVALVPSRPYVLRNNDKIKTGSLVFKFLERGILSETTEKARMQGELETARTVQESLLPRQTDILYKWLQIGGRYRSATECGGDWWWHCAIGNKAFAIVADATGHGAAAALITSAARSAMATLENDPQISLEKIYPTLSHAIRSCSGGNLAMSAFITEVDLKTKKLRFVNASHLPAVVLPKMGAKLIWNKLEFVGDPISPHLGALEQDFHVVERTLPAQTRLVLLTDGMTERSSGAGKKLQESKFYRMLIQTHYQHLQDQKNFLDLLFRKSDELSKSASIDDDITVVTLDFN